MAYLAPLAWGCDGASAEKESPPPPARFQAVTKNAEVSKKDLAGFCDIQNAGAFQLPPTKGPAEPKGARWINLWATWCQSCVEEMPMIESWKSKNGFEVLYVSADEDPEALPKFIKEHSEFPETAIMTDPEGLPGWMKAMGLDAGAGLPLHVFVSADNQVRCARAGAVAAHHLPVVESLLK